MDKLSRFEISALLEMLNILYEELGDVTDDEKEDDVEGSGREYDEGDEQENEDGEETKDYANIFKRETIDYLLSAGAKSSGKTERSDYEIVNTGEKTTEEEQRKEKPEVVSMEYDNPVFFNRQWTYQRIFIENTGNEETVYSLTRKAMETSGMGIESEYDDRFGTLYVTAIDGKKDGEVDKDTGKRMYWEYWIIDIETGEERIGEKSIAEQKLKRKEMIEWRLATEQEAGCGGGISYDPQTLESDPTVNKQFLPSYLQTYMNMKTGTYMPALHFK